MNIKGFFVAALTSALDLGMATCDDVIKHVTPEILAAHLPRPLWARLLTACVGAPRVDATLVVETIGVPNLCEHVPSTIIWACLEEIGTRSIGGTYVPKVVPASASLFDRGSTPSPVSSSVSSAVVPVMSPASEISSARIPLSMAPPPDVIAPPLPVTATQPTPTVPVPEIPGLDNSLGELFGDVAPEDRPTGPSTGRARTPTQQRFRQSSTGIGRLAANARRPQASASAAPPTYNDAESRTGRRAATESEYEVITDVAGRSTDDWKANLAVEDEQLVDWAGSEETMAGNPDVDAGATDRRKR